MSRPYRTIIALLLLTGAVPALFGQAARDSRRSSPSPPSPPPSVQRRIPNWIWAEKGAPGEGKVYFRQPFGLSDTPTLAYLRIASRTAFTAYVNGARVARGSGSQKAVTVYVTARLAKGRNVLAVECAEGGERVGLWFQMTIQYAGGRTVGFISDGAVRVARKADSGWGEVAYEDQRWARAQVLAPVTAEEVEAERGGRASAAIRQASIRRGGEGEAAKRESQVPVPSPPTSEAQRLDTTRIVRYWDIRGDSKAGENIYARPRNTGERMLLTTSVPSPADMPVALSAGFTLFQTDSDHLSTEETAPGIWDFRGPDTALRQVRDYGMDWCYFPHFAFPPKWYADSVPFTRIQCLEHNQPVQAFSPWEPRFGRFLGRGYQELAERYDRENGASALYLGIHGDYGEVGVLMGARTAVPGQREDWKRRFGDLHNHLGWWCADPLARADFRKSMLQKYGELDLLNAAWKTNYQKPEEIAFPSGPSEAERRRWLDFVHWYMNSITGLADTVCRVARRAFPTALLMLPAGFADENPRGGQDNSLIPKIAARYKVEVRSTHGGFKPFAQNQASMLGRLASACRFYGVPFWTEPPGRITPEQQIARIFAAASLGSKGYFDWADNVRETRDVYYRYGRYLKVEAPVVDVAMFFPTTSHLLKPDLGYPATFARGCAEIRDVLNYDIVDERMVLDGALDRYRLLVMWEGAVVEAETLAKIREWVQAGGVLVAYDFGKIETVEGDRSWFTDLFGYAGRLRPTSATLRFVPAAGTALPNHYRINVGRPEATPFLSGDWFEPETLDNVPRRWTGASAEIRVPVNPTKSYSLLLRASFPPEAVRSREVLVNGRPVGEINVPAETTYQFRIPEAYLAGRDMATITIRSETWVPSKVLPNSQDNRALGTWVTYLQMDAADGPAPVADPGPPNGHFETRIDLERLKSEWARPYGRGWTVYYPATRRHLAGYYEVVRYLTYHLSDLDSYRRNAIEVDNAWDGVYATLLSDKILYYNPGPSPVSRTIVLDPASFAGRNDVRKPASMTFKLEIEPNTISAIYLDTPPQELLLQCEKFTDLSGLRPLTGALFSPGQGATHVLIPVGAQIATRFQCEVPGRYRIFYHAMRRGAQAQAEILVDGRVVENREPESEGRKKGGALTFLAGTVELSSGVHTLTFRPRRGEDIRADYVILTTEPTIAGYGFAIKPTAR